MHRVAGAVGPVGAAGYVMVASAAVLAVMLGALAGAIAWALGRWLLWLALLAAVTYFAITVFVESARFWPAAVIGMPPLVLTLLTSWLTAHYLAARWRWRRMPAALVGLGCSLLLGFLWGFLFRLGLWVPVWVALAADACLIAMFYLRMRA